MRLDVFGRRLAVGVCQPTLAQADEYPRVASGGGRIVAVGERAGATGQKGHQRHDEFGPDGLHEPGFGEELLVANGLGDHS